MERQAPQQPNMADTDLLDAPLAEDEETLAPPVRPIRAIAPPVAPDIAPVPAAPPAMPPVAHGPGPNFGTAMDNTIGARPNPNAPQYQPIKPTLGQSILGRIAAGMVGYRNPQAGVAVRREQEQAPIRAAQQKYSTDVNDYNQKFGQEMQLSNEEQNEPLRASEIAKNEATATKELAPVAPKNESPQQGYAQAIQDAITAGRNPADDPHVQAWKAAIDATQKQPNETFQEKTFDEAKKANPNLTRLEFDKQQKEAERTPRAPTDREEWEKDHPGEPIENYWTARAGAGGAAKEQANEESGKAAQQYADDYLKSGRFTGAGDEALMEKYFELAKPSSGFRMTQPQIEMLTHAQDIMNSVVARGKHLLSPESPYFSDTMRQQIVDTMKNLQTARDETKAASGGGKSGAKLTVDQAREYLQKAGGDKDKARAMARKEGKNF